MKLFSSKSEACEVHGHGSSGHPANRSLLFMVAASFSLIIWHVWAYGPTAHGLQPGTAPESFFLLLGKELWDLLFNAHGIVGELREVFPYFMTGILLAGYLRTYKIAVKLHALLRRYGVLSVFLASTIGIITPLCACGTVTTAVSLLFAGLPLAPVMSLMITSSLLSPSTYLLTLNDLGPEWTVIRTIAAYSMGIIAGIATHLLRNKGFNTKNVFIEGAVVVGDFHDEDYPDERLRCNCRQKLGNRVAMRTRNKFLIFLAKSAEMLWPVGKYVLVGVTMGIIVERYIPSEWIYRLFGRKDPLNIVWITLASVPMFLHQISASSILYHIKSSLDGTLDGGAALAFMIGGPVTAVPTMVMFWTIFRKRVFMLYMAICIVGTIAISYAFQGLVFVPGVDTGNPLLKGVASVTGGSSYGLRKQSQDVRIVMDPGGTGIVATYRSDLDGGGGIVFDADPLRFTAAPAGRGDNGRYAANVATWLDQNASAPVPGKILVYDLSSPEDAQGMHSTVLHQLKEKGFTVAVADRRSAPEISTRLLDGYSQLWLFFGNGRGAQLTDRELAVITGFFGSGRSMLVTPGSYQPGRDDALVAVNGLSSRYGVRFAGCAANGSEIRTTVASHMLHRASEMLGKLLKQVHKA